MTMLKNAFRRWRNLADYVGLRWRRQRLAWTVAELGAGVMPYGDPVITGGEHVRIGPGTTINTNVTIGGRAVIAAGAVVTRDVPADAVAMGVPARCKPIAYVQAAVEGRD